MYLHAYHPPLRTLGEAAVAPKFDQCTTTQKSEIIAGLDRARRLVNKASAILGTEYGRRALTNRTRQLLNTHFHTTNRDHIFKIFRTLIRIGRAIDEGLKFECETNCGGGQKCGYAWATQWFGGYG